MRLKPRATGTRKCLLSSVSALFEATGMRGRKVRSMDEREKGKPWNRIREVVNPGKKPLESSLKIEIRSKVFPHKKGVGGEERKNGGRMFCHLARSSAGKPQVVRDKKGSRGTSLFTNEDIAILNAMSYGGFRGRATSDRSIDGRAHQAV